MMLMVWTQTSDDLMTAGEGEKIGNLIVIKPSVMFCAAGTRDYNPFLTVISLIEQSTEQG